MIDDSLGAAWHELRRLAHLLSEVVARLVDLASTQGWGMEVTNPAGGATVYAGGSDVTTGGTNVGRAIPGGTSFAFDLSPGERVYLIVGTGTQAVTVFATGV
jgi:hypothetical protein